MGWIYTYIGYDKRSPKQLMRSVVDSWSDVTILKDAMVNGVYYASCRSAKRPEEVWALICLTKKDGSEFGYKDMDETCGPFECKCPVSILDMLTPTDNKYANEWREACRQYAESKGGMAKALGDLPIGTVIEVEGKVWQKKAPNRQFKTPWYGAYPIAFCYLPKTRIKSFSVVPLSTR